MSKIDLGTIKVGDILTLKEDIDEENIIKEKVTKITNPDIDDLFYQIRTENYDYDFLNFFTILKIN